MVNEGPLTKVGRVRIVGEQTHTEPELTKYLLGPTRERFPRIKRDADLPFVETDVQSGVELVSRRMPRKDFSMR